MPVSSRIQGLPILFAICARAYTKMLAKSPAVLGSICQLPGSARARERRPSAAFRIWHTRCLEHAEPSTLLSCRSSDGHARHSPDAGDGQPADRHGAPRCLHDGCTGAAARWAREAARGGRGGPPPGAHRCARCRTRCWGPAGCRPSRRPWSRCPASWSRPPGSPRRRPRSARARPGAVRRRGAGATLARHGRASCGSGWRAGRPRRVRPPARGAVRPGTRAAWPGRRARPQRGDPPPLHAPRPRSLRHARRMHAVRRRARP